MTGDLDVAQTVARASYARTWQAWPAVRNLDWPVMWVRADAVRRMRRPPRGDRLLQHGLPALPEVALDPEDEVLVAGLQCLPAEHRLPLVLHYLGHVPVETITEWFGDPTEELEVRLDAGFDALVAILDWPDDADDADGESRSGRRLRLDGRGAGKLCTALPRHVPRPAAGAGVPPRNGEEGHPPWSAHHSGGRRGRYRPCRLPLPRPEARCAGCGVHSTAEPGGGRSRTRRTRHRDRGHHRTRDDDGRADFACGNDHEKRCPTSDHQEDGVRGECRCGLARCRGQYLAGRHEHGPDEHHTDEHHTDEHHTDEHHTGGETGTTGGETGTTGGETGTTGGETGGGTGTGSLPGSDSTATDSTGSSVITTTDSTTPTTDETTTGETTSATTTRDHGQDDCPPTTTETADTTTADTTTAETTTTETTSVDPGTTETTTTETQPVVLSLINETNTTTPTVGTATGRSVRSATGQASE